MDTLTDCTLFYMSHVPVIQEVAFMQDRKPFYVSAAPIKQCPFLYQSFGVGNDTKLRGLSPRANYTDRATAACR
jgi:hypothetical protein